MSKSKKFVNISDDAVQCLFFSISTSTNLSYWNDMQQNINKSIETLSHNYIWHKDKFYLYLPISSTSNNYEDIPEHLYSCTQFGDNIEDEWYIVYLLFEITKVYKDLVVQVIDNDGEFLLIESADVLPIWCNPDTTENRVYIHNGSIHIIPPSIISIDKNINIKEAIQAIKMFPNETICSDNIQQIIMKRIEKYNEKNLDNLHRSIVELPLSIATLLTVKPALISALVHAYCTCDVPLSKLKMKTEENVTVTVTFTKCLYAMILHSKTANKQHNLKNSKIIQHTEISNKLVYGYQFLMSNTTDIFSSKQWLKFLSNLKNNAYFGGFIEGSQKYTELLEKAKSYFVSNECPTYTGIANEIKDIMNAEEYKNELEKLKTSEPLLVEDNEDWLYVNPDELDELLTKKYGETIKSKQREIITPQTISNHLTEFLKNTSDFEGIETVDTNKDEDNTIEFDVDMFNDTLKNILRFISSEDNNIDIESDFSEDDDGQDVDEDLTIMDAELKQALYIDTNKDENRIQNDTLSNLTRSMKEEGSSAGPSSNLLNSLGISKTEIMLDSDDDE